MGRRSRQRATAPPPHEPSAPARSSTTSPAPAPRSRGRRRDEAPLPPWGSFPLIELCALSGIVLGVWGLVQGGRGGTILLLFAMLLGSVAGLEVALREHLGGYRSHTLVLSGLLAVVTLATLALARADRVVMVAVAVAVLLGSLVGFRELFKRRSGGVGMKVR